MNWIKLTNEKSLRQGSICLLADGEFDYILKIVKDIEKLKSKWEYHEDDFEEIFKYVVI